jgi:hypothetical protein
MAQVGRTGFRASGEGREGRKDGFSSHVCNLLGSGNTCMYYMYQERITIKIKNKNVIRLKPLGADQCKHIHVLTTRKVDWVKGLTFIFEIRMHEVKKNIFCRVLRQGSVGCGFAPTVKGKIQAYRFTESLGAVTYCNICQKLQYAKDVRQKKLGVCTAG